MKQSSNLGAFTTLALRLALALCCALVMSGPARAKAVDLQFDHADSQASYAAQQLSAALSRSRNTVVTGSEQSNFRIILRRSAKLGEESFAITPQRGAIEIAGGDGRGMIYGAFAVADQLEKGTLLGAVKSSHETPKLHFRAIKFDLPWDSYRASATIDQHLATVKDVNYWQALLDMMARNRFNSITLSTLHPWPYMIRTGGFPEANPFTDSELDDWRRLHHAIFRMAKERGIDTYLLPWNIYVSKQFAEAHKVGQANTYPYYNINGDTSPLIKQYVRQSVAQVLKEYPELTGMGISLGEAMGGMTTDEKLAWVNDTYIAAMRSAHRPIKLIWNLSSVETPAEELAQRKAIEAIDFADGPVQVGLKFNWSHALSSTTLVQIHGGKVGDTYFKPAPKNYRIEWIARNEDVLALRWGVASFVREHVKRNGSADYIGGYTVGSETYIPAVDYFTAATEGVNWKYAFERQWLFYKLWGRLLYNPNTPDTVFSDEFVDRYGAKGSNLLRAYELASATPLRLASLFYSTWDHTLYSEGMLWLNGRSMAYIGVESLIQQPVLDPAYVSIAEYVTATQKGQAFAPDRVTPPLLADQLDRDCREALRLVEGIDTSGNTPLTYEVADLKAWAHLGLHLAEEIRGATALQTYRTAGGEQNKALAVRHLENALWQWDEVVRVTRPLYRDMLLIHFIGNSKALNPDATFHWESVRPQVAADVEIARNARREQ